MYVCLSRFYYLNNFVRFYCIINLKTPFDAEFDSLWNKNKKFTHTHKLKNFVFYNSYLRNQGLDQNSVSAIRSGVGFSLPRLVPLTPFPPHSFERIVAKFLCNRVISIFLKLLKWSYLWNQRSHLKSLKCIRRGINLEKTL